MINTALFTPPTFRTGPGGELSPWRKLINAVLYPDFAAPRPAPPLPAPQTAPEMRSWTPADVQSRYDASLAEWRTNAIPGPTPQPESNWPIIAAVTAATIAALVVFGGNR
jgi:hypothetical protein